MRIKRIWLLEIDFLINFFLLMICFFISEFLFAELLLPILDLLLFAFWEAYYFILNEFDRGYNMKHIIRLYWESITSSIGVLVLSLSTILSDNSFTSFGKFYSNFLACIILGIPTWIVLDLVCHVLNKFNNTEYIKTTHKQDERWNKIMPKWVMLIVGIFIIIFCFYYLIHGAKPMNNMINNIDLSKYKNIINFVNTYMIYLSFWIIVGCIWLSRITSYLRYHYSNVVIHGNFLNIWIKPIKGLITFIGIDLTALSSLSLNVPTIDRIIYYLLYIATPVYILGIVLEERLRILNKINDKIHRDKNHKDNN